MYVWLGKHCTLIIKPWDEGYPYMLPNRDVALKVGPKDFKISKYGSQKLVVLKEMG